jgi:hypothetical protein
MRGSFPTLSTREQDGRVPTTKERIFLIGKKITARTASQQTKKINKPSELRTKKRISMYSFEFETKNYTTEMLQSYKNED